MLLKKDYKIYSIMFMEKSNNILNTLRKLFPDAKCELEYHNIYELLIAVSLSAQTTDKRVNIVTKQLFKLYPTPYELSKASYDDVYNCIKSLGLAQIKTKNIIALSNKLINDFSSGNSEYYVPNTREELMTLPGVGRKTANVILSEGFKIPAIAVDTHIARVSNRLGLVKSNDVYIIEQTLMKLFDESDWYIVHHTLLFFGRYLCKAKNPECNRCPFKENCEENI